MKEGGNKTERKVEEKGREKRRGGNKEETRERKKQGGKERRGNTRIQSKIRR